MRIIRWLGVARIEITSHQAQKSRCRIFSTLAAKMASPTTIPETTFIDGKKYRQVREGLASVLAPYSAETSATETSTSSTHPKNNDEGNQAVFYNPIQQFNRDLSVLAITVYGEGALLEKQNKLGQKVQHAKRTKNKRRLKYLGVEQSNDNAGGGSEKPNPRKRSAEEPEDPLQDVVAQEPAKRLKGMDGVEDEDEDTPVAELIARPADDQNGHEKRPKQQEESGLVKIQPDQAATSRKQLPFTILDALSATGLRALRYAKEVPFATNIVANDLSPDSVESIKLNIKYNQVEAKVRSNLGDARAYMYSKVGNEHSGSSEGYVHRFDVIDIDPYGTAAPFFDCSLQALQDGGMLCVTCTDAGVFASTGYPEKTFALYGGMPIKGAHSHEGGLRLILNGVAMSAAKYGLAIEPLLSLNIDYYARLFIRIHKKQQDVKLLAGTSMIVYNCGHGCGAWVTQPLLRNQPQTSKSGDTFYKFGFSQVATPSPNCEHCGSRLHLCGPMWAGPLHNPYFVQRMLEKLPSLEKEIYGTVDRLEGMLTLALEEDLTLQTFAADKSPAQETDKESGPDSRIIPRLATDKLDIAPFFFVPTYLAKIIHCATPSESAVRGALIGLGYKVSRSHCKAGSIKTNASWSVLWEIIREYMRTKVPIKEGAVKKGTPGWNILGRLRESERGFVTELKDNTKERLSKCDTKEDLKTVLQAMLYRLDNEHGTVNKEGGGSNESNETNEQVEDPGKEQGNGDLSKGKVSAIPALSKLDIIFDERLGKEKPRGKLVRYQMNPRQFWGPMNRAGSKA